MNFPSIRPEIEIFLTRSYTARSFRKVALTKLVLASESQLPKWGGSSASFRWRFIVKEDWLAVLLNRRKSYFFHFSTSQFDLILVTLK